MRSHCVLLMGLLLLACSSSDEPGDSGIGSGGAPSGSGGASDGAPGADTWSNFAQAFFATYCVSCHDGSGTPKGDFRKFADVDPLKSTIRCGVATSVLAGCEQSSYPPRQFPVGNGPKPTDGERSRLVAWIDAGAKE